MHDLFFYNLTAQCVLVNKVRCNTLKMWRI